MTRHVEKGRAEREFRGAASTMDAMTPAGLDADLDSTRTVADLRERVRVLTRVVMYLLRERAR